MNTRRALNIDVVSCNASKRCGITSRTTSRWSWSEADATVEANGISKIGGSSDLCFLATTTEATAVVVSTRSLFMGRRAINAL